VLDAVDVVEAVDATEARLDPSLLAGNKDRSAVVPVSGFTLLYDGIRLMNILSYSLENIHSM